MSEMSRGFNDEHMNEEALAELQRSQDLGAQLDDIEQMLAKGDVEGAMRELDKMASQMDQMLAGLERNAGLPDEKAQELMKQMLAFKKELEDVKGEQEKTAAETDKLRQKYREALRQRLKDAEERVNKLQKLAEEARKDVDQAQPGVTYRAEPEFDQARDSLDDLQRALGMKELGSAFESAQRAAPAVERLSRFLEEDVALSQQNPAFTRRDPQKVKDAQKSASRAVPKVRQIRDELAQMFPDPRTMMGPQDQQKMEGLTQRQSQLERRAGDLQRKLQELMQQAPIFPPNAQMQLGEGRGHMGQAASELAQKNPQRGHGQQELALDALSRFQKGLEDAAKRGQGKGGGGMGFPFPFGEQGGGEEGDGRDPSREKVSIPGAEAYKVPEEFRKDLLDAMKQGAPERYRGEVQRYYEELVK
jgi:DNA repair exonuclease SbcCD ATPase subunit